MITDRRSFIGGSDARIIMGNDEARLLRLWREKRGEIEPEDLSQDLIVQLGSITEELNRTWYERNTGNAVDDVQRKLRHPIRKWMRATLDGREMGGIDNSCRPALPAPAADRGKEVLALCRKWRAASPLRDRVAQAETPGGPNFRHERLQCLGGVCQSVMRNPACCARPRSRQGGA